MCSLPSSCKAADPIIYMRHLVKHYESAGYVLEYSPAALVETSVLSSC